MLQLTHGFIINLMTSVFFQWEWIDLGTEYWKHLKIQINVNNMLLDSQVKAKEMIVDNNNANGK